MTDAALSFKVDSEGVATAGRRLTDLAQASDKAGRSAEGFAASQKKATTATERLAKDAERITKVMREMELAQAGAVGMSTNLSRIQAAVSSAHSAGARNAKLQAHEVMNLGRQFGDLATMAAMGASPMQMISSQGAQVAEIFATARARGVTFGHAMGELGGLAGRAAMGFAPLTLGIGAAVGGFALFERAVDSNTKHATTWGDTWKAVLQVVGDAIMSGPVGEGLRWLGKAFSATLDAIVGGTMAYLDRMVGFWGAAYNAVVKNWRNLPQVFAAIMQAAANNALWAVEGIVNTVIKGINHLAGKELIKALDLPEVRVATGKVVDDFAADQKRISASFKASREAFLRDIAAQADKNYEARQKATKATKDHTAARKDEADAASEQAKALQAYLAAQDEELKRLQYSPEQIQMMEAEAKASDALAKGMLVEAAAILRKAEAIRQLRAMQDKKPANDNFDFVVTPKEIGEIVLDEAPSWADQFEQVAEAARSIGYALDDVKYSLTAGDWTSAVQGLVRAMKSVRDAFDKTKGGGIVNGLSATASAAGSMIGGGAGGVLSGMGAGMSLGASLGTIIPGIGNAVGAAVGAVIGGLGGLFGGGSQKAEEKRQRDLQQMEAARQKAEQVTQARRELELQLIEASGDATAALAARRKAELEAMDASLRALQERVWARQDAAQREAAIRAYDIQLMEAQGNAAGALALQREQELKAMDASLRGIQQLVWNVLDVKAAADKANADAQAGVDQARDRLTEAYRREADALTKTAERFRSLAQTLADFRRDLFAGDTASLNPLQQYRASRAEFDRVSTLARSGDETALGNLPSVAQAFLSASRAVATNGGAYNRDLALVRQAVTEAEKVATAQADTAELQLAELQRQVSGLIDINGSVLSVRDAVAGLNAALANQAAVQAQQNTLMAQALGAAQQAMAEAKAAQEAAAAAKPTSPSYTAAGWAGYVQGNQDLAAAYAAGTGMARGHTIEQFAQLHWERYGQYENRSVRPYARGGMHSGGLRLVGEEGPELEVTGPSRIFSADQTRDLLAGDNSELIAEVRALRSEVASLKSSAEKTAKSVDDMNKTGVYARGQQPGAAVEVEAA